MRQGYSSETGLSLRSRAFRTCRQHWVVRPGERNLVDDDAGTGRTRHVDSLPQRQGAHQHRRFFRSELRHQRRHRGPPALRQHPHAGGRNRTQMLADRVHRAPRGGKHEGPPPCGRNRVPPPGPGFGPGPLLALGPADRWARKEWIGACSRRESRHPVPGGCSRRRTDPTRSLRARTSRRASWWRTCATTVADALRAVAHVVGHGQRRAGQSRRIADWPRRTSRSSPASNSPARSWISVNAASAACRRARLSA